MESWYFSRKNEKKIYELRVLPNDLDLESIIRLANVTKDQEYHPVLDLQKVSLPGAPSVSSQRVSPNQDSIVDINPHDRHGANVN